MKHSLLFLFCITLSLKTFSQALDTVLSKPKLCNNSISGELGGNTGLYALNFEKFVINSTYVGAYATVGASYIWGKYSNNTGIQKTISMPGEINHANIIAGGTLVLRKELFWKWFKIQRVAKNKKNKVSYLELGFFHIWNTPNLSPSNNPGSTYERGNPWNNIYVGYNMFRSKPGIFVRFGALININKKGDNILNDSGDTRFSPLPTPRLMIGYTF